MNVSAIKYAYGLTAKSQFRDKYIYLNVLQGTGYYVFATGCIFEV
jgi:hypothetical protein